MNKIELKTKKEGTGKIIKYLSIDKTKIPLTDEEYAFLKKKIGEHIRKHGITYGFVYNLFLKEDSNNEDESKEQTWN